MLGEYLGLLPLDHEYYGRVPITRSGSGTQSAGKAVQWYSYFDAKGVLVHQVVRCVPKSFFQRHLDSRGNWVYNMQGVQPVLYRLPELAARPDELVIFVEGEKDVHTVERLGFLATTSPMGAQAWHRRYASSLAGRRVVCLPDCNDAGREYMGRVQSDVGRCGGDARILNLAGLAEGEDVTDWLKTHTADELRELIKEAQDGD